MEVAATSSCSPTNPTASTPSTATVRPTPSEREIVRAEFYRTYDVMTGVRIAATLGGFFGLMVMLVVYKSKCKSRSLSDQHLEAAAAAAVEEDEMELAAVLSAYSLYGPRRSLGNMSSRTAPARFSSVGGGYSNLMNPPARYCYGRSGRVSLPGSTRSGSIASPFLNPGRHLKQHRAYPEEPEDVDEEEEVESMDDYPRNFLQVPTGRRHSRRLSSITCSSADSSYLERRGSAVEVGLPAPPPFCRNARLPEEPWDFYYPIDIQVIQPTPLVSPCGSENNLYDHVNIVKSSQSLVPPRLAPLASISSCGLPSLSSEPPDIHSVGSDSVFLDEELVDTEDEVEEFSTDSDVDEEELCPSNRNVPFAEHLCVSTQYPRTLAGRWHGNPSIPPVVRRFSSPGSRLQPPIRRQSQVLDDDQYPSCSKSCDKFSDHAGIGSRPPLPLPPCSSDSETLHVSLNRKPNHLSSRKDLSDAVKCAILQGSLTSEAVNDRRISETPSEQIDLVSTQPNMSASCDHLVKMLQEHREHITGSMGSMKSIVKNCSWSQETLF